MKLIVTTIFLTLSANSLVAMQNSSSELLSEKEVDVLVNDIKNTIKPNSYYGQFEKEKACWLDIAIGLITKYKPSDIEKFLDQTKPKANPPINNFLLPVLESPPEIPAQKPAESMVEKVVQAAEPAAKRICTRSNTDSSTFKKVDFTQKPGAIKEITIKPEYSLLKNRDLSNVSKKSSSSKHHEKLPAPNPTEITFMFKPINGLQKLRHNQNQGKFLTGSIKKRFKRYTNLNGSKKNKD